MGEIVDLHPTPIDITSDRGRAFVIDATRAAEGLLTDAELQEAYELTPADWVAITKDAALGRAVRDERARRVRNGTAARESACRHFVKAPGILDGIMTDAQSNPRHKIEAIKELRATAAIGSADRPRETERFIIRIDLTAGGGDVETWEKTINIDTTNGDSPDNVIPSEGKPDVDGQW